MADRKQRIAVMLGFKGFRNAATTIAGIELLHRIRKAQFRLRRLGVPLLRSAGAEAATSLFLAKFGVTSIAGVGGCGVGGSDRCLVAGLHYRDELCSRTLHCRDQLIDMVAGVKNRRFDLALRHIRTRKKQGPVESAGERGNGFRRRHHVRTVGGSALHDAADADIKWGPRAASRLGSSRCLA
jgi:hypothetical protein